ncbi:MAG: hypothetical protein HY695_37565 [Deltaproteobacteria bacterium]|nr:hypothetical protein [Deltaproteobacteria bacterium]
MRHVERLGNEIRFTLPSDEDGLTGRECPSNECEGYFKIQFGTGLKGENLPCHCPYCGHCDGHDKFFTKEQVNYVESVALNKVTDALLKDLKSLEFQTRPKGAFGIGISMKVKGRPHPIRYYREKQLETEVACDRCTLRYMIYGVFGFCPDCGVHNSLQILKKNLELIEKMLTFAETQEPALAQMWIANALEDCVAAFDGFGRETCRVFSDKAADASKATNISFQNIDRANQRVQDLYGVDFTKGLDADQWALVLRCFQKRHLLAHKMGVIDQDYIDATRDTSAVVGRKIQIQPAEVRRLLTALRTIGEQSFDSLTRKP